MSAVIRLGANAIGLMVAAYFLDDMTITGAAFITAVLIFTVVEVLIDPLLMQIALTKATALRGSVALITTFFGLVVTSWLSDGLSIEGAETWLFATIIVWLAALLAGLLLPLILVKKAVSDEDGNRRR